MKTSLTNTYGKLVNDLITVAISLQSLEENKYNSNIDICNSNHGLALLGGVFSGIDEDTAQERYKILKNKLREEGYLVRASSPAYFIGNESMDGTPQFIITEE